MNLAPGLRNGGTQSGRGEAHQRGVRVGRRRDCRCVCVCVWTVKQKNVWFRMWSVLKNSTFVFDPIPELANSEVPANSGVFKFGVESTHKFGCRISGFWLCLFVSQKVFSQEFLETLLFYVAASFENPESMVCLDLLTEESCSEGGGHTNCTSTRSPTLWALDGGVFGGSRQSEAKSNVLEDNLRLFRLYTVFQGGSFQENLLPVPHYIHLFGCGDMLWIRRHKVWVPIENPECLVCLALLF